MRLGTEPGWGLEGGLGDADRVATVRNGFIIQLRSSREDGQSG